MRNYLSGVLTGIVIGISISSVYIVSYSAAAPPALQSARFRPAVLTIESQRVGERIAREAWDVSPFYFLKLREPRSELAGAVNYVDALATIEVMADRWIRAHNIQPTSDHYFAFLCILSWGIGCPPKTRENRDIMLSVRDRLIDGAFFDESKRDDIRGRLRDIPLSQVTAARMASVRVDQLIDLRGLR